MADVETTLAVNHDAIGDLSAAAERSGGAWTVPPAPGKWSPSQIVEHVARSLDDSANVVSGARCADSALRSREAVTLNVQSCSCSALLICSGTSGLSATGPR